MALNIKDPETDRVMRRLAELTGENITVAVRRAAEERLRREESVQGKASLGELIAIVEKYAALPFIDPPSADETTGYDEHRLPA